MKKITGFALLVLALLTSFPGWAQVEQLPMMPSSGIVSYSNYPINELNRAHRQQLTGQFEVALLTYNSALAFQPDWIPVLTARAALLQRLGRNLEAKRDFNQALRTNKTATAFFMARGHNGLLPFIALYPKDWYAQQYGFSAGIEAVSPRAQLPFEYFDEQYNEITTAPDTSLAVQLLKEKVNQNVLVSRRMLEEFPPNYNFAVRRMLEANLAMLNHDYPEAINLYTDAESKSGVDWPELKYNRGLGYILMYNYMNGCEDLAKASGAGFAPAVAMYDCLCNL